MDARLPAHLEVSALIRQVQSAGGFAMVLHKGEAEAGTILLVLCENGTKSRSYERMPGADGTRNWHRSKTEDPENKQEFNQYIARRHEQDADLWIVELDIAQAERFIGLAPTPS
jgi:hypothetical protein